MANYSLVGIPPGLCELVVFAENMSLCARAHRLGSPAVAWRTPLQDVGGRGDAQRPSPTGGAAYGIELNTFASPPGRPCSTPYLVVTVGPPAAATAAAAAASNTQAIAFMCAVIACENNNNLDDSVALVFPAGSTFHGCGSAPDFSVLPQE